MWISKVVLGPFKARVLPTTFSFGERANAIYADNRKGKTTIRDSIVFCFYGTDEEGSNIGLDKLFNDEQKEEYHRIPSGLETRFGEWAQYRNGTFIEKLEAFRKEHQLFSEQPIVDVAVWFTDNDGKERVVSRRRTFKGSTTLKLGGKTVSNKELAKTLPEKDLFLSVFVNGYFFSLSEKKQRDLLRKHMINVDWREILSARAAESDQRAAVLATQDVEAGMQLARDNHLMQARRVHELEAEAKILQGDIANLQAGQAGVNTSTAESKVAVLAKSVENTLEWESRLSVVEATNAERARHNVGVEQEKLNVKQTNERNEARVKEIDVFLDANANAVEPVNAADQLRAKLGALTVEQVQLPPRPERPAVMLDQPPIAGSLQRCPECGANLEAYMAEELTRISVENEKKKKQADDKYAAACAAWETGCTDLSAKHTAGNAGVFEKRGKLQTAIDTAQEKYNGSLRDYHRTVAQCTSLAQERASIDVTIENPQVLPLVSLPDGCPYKAAQEAHAKMAATEVDLAAAREELRALVSRTSAAQATAEMRDKKSAALAELPDKIITAKRLKEELETLRHAVEELPTHILRLQLADVQEHIPNVSISFYKEVKETGAFEPSLQFLFNNTPYPVLSNSERLMIAIEIGTLLNLLSGRGVPIFADNSESITKLPKALGKQQYFAAYVSKSHKEIVVAGR